MIDHRQNQQQVQMTAEEWDAIYLDDRYYVSGTGATGVIRDLVVEVLGAERARLALSEVILLENEGWRPSDAVRRAASLTARECGVRRDPHFD